MRDVGAVVAEVVGLFAAGQPPLAAVGLDAVVEAPWPLRALATFVLVAGLGCVLVYRHEPFLDRSIDASAERPLASLGYGLAAHAVIAFAAVYLANKLGRYGVLGQDGPLVGLLLGGVLALAAATVGFTVVGVTVAGLRGGRRNELGLALGGLVAAAAVALASTVSALVWFVVVSMGIGGAVRKWLHASAGPEL